MPRRQANQHHFMISLVARLGGNGSLLCTKIKVQPPMRTKSREAKYCPVIEVGHASEFPPWPRNNYLLRTPFRIIRNTQRSLSARPTIEASFPTFVSLSDQKKWV